MGLKGVGLWFYFSLLALATLILPLEPYFLQSEDGLRLNGIM